jgi:tetratricopeptide (TPR) repeat protein
MHRPNPRHLPLLCLAVLCAASCSDSQAASSPAPAAAAPEQMAVPLPEDAPLEPWQAELLELAMDAAGALPVYPHIKTRSLAQESVVEACIALGQPRRALECNARIGNWRRGVGYAGLALHLAERGIADGVDELVALAEVEARLEGEENPQDWQRDLIRSKIAAALLQLGRAGDALAFESGVEDAEYGRIAAAKSALLSRDELEVRLAELDALLATATLDQLRSALVAAIELYARAFGEQELRARCEDWIARASLKVPAQIRLETRLELSRRAVEQGDPAEALTQVTHARAVLDGQQWLPEDRVPLTARVAAARFAAGDVETARRELSEARRAYDEGYESIPDFWRGSALRPLAEACASTGEREQALTLYRRAAEEGVRNPNARPRTEDLVATCLSLARLGVQPDKDLVERLRATRTGLTDPW